MKCVGTVCGHSDTASDDSGLLLGWNLAADTGGRGRTLLLAHRASKSTATTRRNAKRCEQSARAGHEHRQAPLNARAA